MSQAKRALQDLGYSREQVNKLMFMVKWLSSEGYLDALKLYVRFYNRGAPIGDKERAEFEQQLKDIEALTINGLIMSPYTNIHSRISGFNGTVVSAKSHGSHVSQAVMDGGVMVITGNAMRVA